MGSFMSRFTINKKDYFTTADGMLGLLGFTTIVWRDGEMTRSMSSIETAPSNVRRDSVQNPSDLGSRVGFSSGRC